MNDNGLLLSTTKYKQEDNAKNESKEGLIYKMNKISIADELLQYLLFHIYYILLLTVNHLYTFLK